MADLSISGSGRGTVASTGASSTSSGGAGRGAGTDIRSLTIFKTRPDSIVDKKGMRGSFVELHTNYFAVNNMPNSRMEQWRVDFKPDSDNMFLKKRLVNSLMTELGHFVFDGTLLYTFYKLAGGDDPRVNRVVTDPESNQQYTIVMKLVGEVCMNAVGGLFSIATIRRFFQVHSDETRYLLVLNIILRKCMEHLKLAKVGREFYDPLGEVALKQWKLQLWPGYTTSIRQHETKILLNCDTKFKVTRLIYFFLLVKG